MQTTAATDIATPHNNGFACNEKSLQSGFLFGWHAPSGMDNPLTMRHLDKLRDGRTDGRTDGDMDKQADGWIDRQTS